jgi:Peptidase family C25
MASNPADKLIVSNCAQLTQKYGATGAAAVVKAVAKLMKADAARGLVSAFVDLSDPTAMAAYGASPLSAADAGDPKKNKDAIDKLFNSGHERQPAYLLLLGSTDVIPHVPLANPLLGDGDPDVPSDLPYAHSHPYSDDVQDYINPTRVVGRLPNVTGDTNEGYLVGLLDTAATYTQRADHDYLKFLGISADVWKTSSQSSLTAVFGTSTGMKVSPPDGYKWTAAEAKRLVHFVNCHGATLDSDFYGQHGASFPVAHSAAWMASKVVEATVMAAECCYGAELYDPNSPVGPGRMGMCNTYLERKAYAYLGSTNIAYGPAAANDQADLICQFFLSAVLGGASVGRACLQARLNYVQKKGGVLTPADLKTLAQFNLMADPSLTPVAIQPTRTVIATARGAKGLELAHNEVARFGRTRRRLELAMQAAATAAYRLSPPSRPRGPAKTGIFGKLRKFAAEHGIKSPDVILSYEIGPGLEAMDAKGIVARAARAGTAPRAVHAVLERLDPPKDAPKLRLVRGVQGIEFEDGVSVQAFESR